MYYKSRDVSHTLADRASRQLCMSVCNGRQAQAKGDGERGGSGAWGVVRGLVRCAGGSAARAVAARSPLLRGRAGRRTHRPPAAGATQGLITITTTHIYNSKYPPFGYWAPTKMDFFKP